MCSTVIGHQHQQKLFLDSSSFMKKIKLKFNLISFILLMQIRVFQKIRSKRSMLKKLLNTYLFYTFLRNHRQWWSSISSFVPGILFGVLAGCIILAVILPLWLVKGSTSEVTSKYLKIESLSINKLYFESIAYCFSNTKCSTAME